MLDELGLGSAVVTLATLDKAFADVPPGMGAMAIIGKIGDYKVIWDRTKPAEVEIARESFAKLRNQGYVAFSVKGADGEKDVQVNTFDPNLERVIFSPQLVGG